ncbi:MAG: phosphomannomutase/phosphoglucomutase [bacterium]|nr:phosphomannomutase/phosphoglucomutase [bacterium]
MNLNQSIFKSYDIRGIYPAEINEEAAQYIAQALVNLITVKLNKPVGQLKIAVGRDNRAASEPLIKAVIEVLLNNGVSVDDLGLISTNDYYFVMGCYGYDAGLMATASHNPAEYGGFKMTIFDTKLANSFEFISGKALLEEVNKVASLVKAEAAGVLNQKDLSAEHLEHIFSFVDLNKIKPLKVVADTGGGMTSLMIPKIFAKLPCELIPIFSELDSTFSSRPPNPLTEGASQACAEKVVAEKADLGIMFDVDGDRFFLIDERGNFIRGDMTLLLLAKVMLAKNPGAGIVYNLICSHSVKDLVAKWGGRPIRSEVGYMNLARHMRQEGGLMSGEVSGHFAFKDNFYSDNAFVALVLALQTISEDGRPLSQIIKDYDLYAKGAELNLQVENIPEKLEKIRAYYQENILDEMDGITVEFADWWFNVRASNTEPLLRITVEAKTVEELKKHQAEILEIIK